MTTPVYKKIFYFICGLLAGAACLFVSYLSFQNSSVDLKKLDNYYGKVTVSKLGRKKVSNVFVFKVENLNQIFGVYDIKQDYSDLINNIKVGDTITVYYQKSYNVNKINVDVYQINKGPVTLLPLIHKTKQEKIAGFIGLIGGLMILFLSVRAFIKK